MLATDIAARGLDVPSVDHVVHYQIPRTADAYVHRNGRTARAKRSGFSMLMCGPDERRLVRALLGSLGRREFKSKFHDTEIDYRHICRGKRHPGNVSRAPSPGQAQAEAAIGKAGRQAAASDQEGESREKLVESYGGSHGHRARF